MKHNFNYIILTILVSFFCPVILRAQTSDEISQIKKEIAKIKKSDNYIYSEVTSEIEAEAKSLAEDLLWQQINEWAASQKKLAGYENLLIKNINSSKESYALPRGNMYRYFVYVAKKDIMGGDNSEIITTTGHTATPVSNAAEAKAKSEGMAGSSTAGASGTTGINPVITELLKYNKYDDFVSKLKQLKESKRVAYFARYASLANPEIFYLAIYNKDGEMMGILSPGTERKNLKTGQPDDVVNYKGCGAIGFSMVE